MTPGAVRVLAGSVTVLGTWAAQGRRTQVSEREKPVSALPDGLLMTAGDLWLSVITYVKQRPAGSYVTVTCENGPRNRSTRLGNNYILKETILEIVLFVRFLTMFTKATE